MKKIIQKIEMAIFAIILVLTLAGSAKGQPNTSIATAITIPSNATVLKFGTCNTKTGSFNGYDSNNIYRYYRFSVPNNSQNIYIAPMVHDAQWNNSQYLSWELVDANDDVIYSDISGNNVISYDNPDFTFAALFSDPSFGLLLNTNYYIRIFIHPNPTKVTPPDDGFFAINVSAGYSSSALTCATLLPITMLSFDGVCQGSNKIFLWETAKAESANYTLEASVDARQWQPIKNITTTQTKTQFNIVDNSSYYRLKITDNAGAVSYSPTKKVSCEVSQKISINNPVNSNIFLVGDVLNKPLKILDMTGRTVLMIDKISSSILDASSLKPGIYMLNIGDNKYLKFIKQ